MCGSATLAMVMSSACMIVASMTDTVTKPRCVLAGLAAVMGCVSERETQQSAAMAGVDFHPGTEACTQLRHSRLGIELDSQRDPLGDLDPVAGGVLRRDDRELGAGGRAQAFDHALPGGIGIGVDTDGDRLARADVGEVGLGEVGLNPEVAANDQ